MVLVIIIAEHIFKDFDPIGVGIIPAAVIIILVILTAEPRPVDACCKGTVVHDAGLYVSFPARVFDAFPILIIGSISCRKGNGILHMYLGVSPPVCYAFILKIRQIFQIFILILSRKVLDFANRLVLLCHRAQPGSIVALGHGIKSTLIHSAYII